MDREHWRKIRRRIALLMVLLVCAAEVFSPEEKLAAYAVSNEQEAAALVADTGDQENVTAVQDADLNEQENVAAVQDVDTAEASETEQEATSEPEDSQPEESQDDTQAGDSQDDTQAGDGQNTSGVTDETGTPDADGNASQSGNADENVEQPDSMDETTENTNQPGDTADTDDTTAQPGTEDTTDDANDGADNSANAAENEQPGDSQNTLQPEVSQNVEQPDAAENLTGDETLENSTEEIGLLEETDADQAVALASTEYPSRVYWNPNGSPTFDADGAIIAAGGDDDNSGHSEQTPVKSLEKMLELAGASQVYYVYCMNLYDVYESTTVNLNRKILTRYTNSSGASHDGIFFYVNPGITLNLSNITTTATAGQEDIEVENGTVVLGANMNLAGAIRLTSPTADSYPVVINNKNGSNGSKYIISFDTGVDLDAVGIAQGNQVANLKLSDALTEANWELVYREDGNTYAQKMPTIIYLDGVNGDDNAFGGTPEHPVRTFGRAKELLTSHAKTASTINVLNTVTVTDQEEWILSDTGVTEPKLVRNASCRGPVLRLAEGAEVSLHDIQIDGTTGGGNLIEVKDGILHVGNAENTTENSTTLAGGNGWGIYAEVGQLIIANASVSGTGGVYAGAGVTALSLKNSSLVTNGNSADQGAAFYYGSNSLDLTPEQVTFNGACAIRAAAGTLHLAEGNTIGNTVKVENSATVETNVDIPDMATEGTLTVNKGTIKTLTMSGGTTVIHQGTVVTMTVDDGNASIEGGNIANLSGNGGTVTIQDGMVSALNVGGGTVSANGGTITKTDLTGENAVLHTNGAATLGSVSLTGQNSKLQLSDALQQETIIQLTVARINQKEDQILVCPEENGNLTDASGQLEKFQLTSGDWYALAGVNPNIVLQIQGVFIDTENGNDGNGDGSKAFPVRTFKKAGELAEEKLGNQSDAGKYIVVLGENGATISGADSLELTTPGIIVVPYENSIATLLTVQAGASFTTKNVTFHGALGTREGMTKSTDTIFEVTGMLELQENTAVTGATAQLLHTTENSTVQVEEGASLNVTAGNGITCNGGTVKLSGMVQKANVSNSNAGYGVQLVSGTLTVQEKGTITGMQVSGIRAEGGTVILNGGTITGNGRSGQGGGLYLGTGAVLQVEKSTAIKGNEAADGGGLYWQAGAEIKTTDGTVLTLESNQASKGGGLYLAADSTNSTFTLDSKFQISSNSADNGGAIYGAGGTITYNGATVTKNTATEDGQDLYLGTNASFIHQSSALGEVAAEGSYQLNMAEVSVSVTKITLKNGNHPLILLGNTNALSGKTFPVHAGLAFLNHVIVQGNTDVSAKLSQFSVEGVDASEKEPNIVGATSIDVFWDPAKASTDTKDENTGTSSSDAVLSWERAKALLSEKSSESRIVLCSQCSTATATLPTDTENSGYKLLDGSVTNSETGATWNATIVRGQDAAGNYQTGNMIYAYNSSGHIRLKNITLSGSFVNASQTASAGKVDTILCVLYSYVILDTGTVLCDNENITREYMGSAIYSSNSSRVTMKEGSKVTNNGGSYAITLNGGLFTLDGGSICDNKGYAVYVYANNSYFNYKFNKGCISYDRDHGGKGGITGGVTNSSAAGHCIITIGQEGADPGSMIIEGSGSTSQTGIGVFLDGHQTDLYLYDGALITGNSTYGIQTQAAEYVYLKGGEISGNTGPGVYAQRGNIFFENIVISNNEAAQGGGVFVALASDSYTVNMGQNGTCPVIENNQANNGAGIWLASGTLNIEGGKITGNTAKYTGGGVCRYDAASATTLNISGGEISDNTAGTMGGGIYLAEAGTDSNTATINGGTITGNHAEASGGGIAVNGSADVTISGSTTLSGNTASTGGGLYLDQGSASDKPNVTLGTVNIAGNHSISDQGQSSGVYVNQANAYFSGSKVNASDVIFLNSKSDPLQLTESMHRGVTYRLAMSDAYKYGDVVVKPGGTLINAAQYLRYMLPIKTGNVLVKGKSSDASTFNDAIVLERSLFVSDDGDDYMMEAPRIRL